jgi:hypothetical protein
VFTGRTAVVVLLGTLTGAARLPATDPPGTRYYVAYFGSEAGKLRPRYTHSWATYVKVTPQPGGAVAVEPHPISWLPASGAIRFRPFRREPGANRDLHESFAYAAATGQRVAVWGPYEIDGGRFAAAVSQRAYLETAGLDYRQVDSLRRPGVNNCVTAILDADPRTAGDGYPPLRVGFKGTAAIVRDQADYGAFLAGPPATSWLLPALGVRTR